MRFETLTLSLPSHWIAPVLYGDLSPLSETEADAFTRWLRDTQEDLGHGKPVYLGSVNTDPYFSRYHDATDYGVLPCECYDVDILVES